jgi:hypothetical protein
VDQPISRRLHGQTAPKTIRISRRKIDARHGSETALPLSRRGTNAFGVPGFNFSLLVGILEVKRLEGFNLNPPYAASPLTLWISLSTHSAGSLLSSFMLLVYHIF